MWGIVMRLAFGSSIPFIFESNWLGIGFAAFVAVIASLNLILDFDLIESSAALEMKDIDAGVFTMFELINAIDVMSR